MKKVKISDIVLPEKSGKFQNSFYKIPAGSDNSMKFKSIRNAKKYLSFLNKELNLILHECNFLYGIIFNEYRQIWFYLYNSDAISNRQILREIETNCKNNFETIDKTFNFMTSRSGTSVNDNFFVFNWLINIITAEINISKEIVRLSELKKLYICKNKFEILNSQALELLQKITFLKEKFLRNDK